MLSFLSTRKLWAHSLIALISSVSLEAATWSLPAPIDTSVGSTGDIFTCFDPATNQLVATWKTTAGQYSKTYTLNSWNNFQAFGSGSQKGTGVFAAYGSGQFVATYQNSATNPYYATYDGTSWTEKGAIVNGPAESGVVYVTSASANELVATWAPTSNPYYAFYNGTSWSSSSPIDSFANVGGLFNVFVASNLSGTLVATWTDHTSHYPSYSVYTGSLWSTTNTITVTSTTLDDVFISYDPNSSAFIATWQDHSTGNPYYSVYSGGTWSLPAAIITTSSVSQDVITCFNPSTGQMFAAWVNAENNPVYATYTGGVWTYQGGISSTSVSSLNVGLGFDSATDQIIATWKDTTSGYPYYATLPEIISTISSFTGQQKKNQFGIAKEWFNQLSWDTVASTSSYALYRNGTLIATLGSGATSYQDHDRNPKVSDTYLLVALNSSGETQASSTLTVQ